MTSRYCALGLSMLLLCAGGCGPAAGPPAEVRGEYTEEAYVEYEGDFLPSDPPANMELIAQKGYAAMFCNPENGDFAVEDMRTGELFYSNPSAEGDSALERSNLLVIDAEQQNGMLKTKNSADAQISLRKTESGFQAWYAFAEEKYAVPVDYSLCEDGLRVRVIADQIIEKGTARIYSISILPFFHAQSGRPEGFLLIPDGSGALMRLDRDKTGFSPYLGTLYGDSYLTAPNYTAAVGENCLIPFLGLQGKNGGVLALAENAAAGAQIAAAAEGQGSGYSHAYFQFDLRKRQDAVIGNPETFNSRAVVVSETGPITLKHVSARYFLLDSAPDTGLRKMAETARAVVDGTAGELKETSGAQMYLTTLGGYTAARPALGLRTQTTKAATTFEAAARMMERLRADGAAETALIYTGYERTALRGGISENLQPDRAVGSAAELKMLSDSLGAGRLLLAVNPVVFREKSKGLNPNRSSVFDLSRKKILHYSYKRNTFLPDRGTAYYLLKTDRASHILRGAEEWTEKNTPSAGILITEFGEKLYGDYGQNGYTRLQAAVNVRDTLRRMSERKPVYTKGANYDAALFSSAILNAPGSASEFDLFDESVPFYQMIFGGKRQLVSRPLNLSGDPARAFLDCVRFGMVPHYELLSENLEMPGAEKLDSFYAADFAQWKTEIVSRYRQYGDLFRAAAGSALTDYQAVGAGLYRLTYSNGVTVAVNASDKAAAVNGQTVGAGQFSVLRD